MDILQIFCNMMIGFDFIVYASIALISVILIEWIFILKYISGKISNILILAAVVVSNIISTFLGRGILSEIIVDLNKLFLSLFNIEPEETSSFEFIFLFTAAFIITIIIEAIVNILFLKKEFDKKSIIKGTLYSNTITYILLGILLFFTI